jgi:hypothetical protein
MKQGKSALFREGCHHADTSPFSPCSRLQLRIRWDIVSKTILENVFVLSNRPSIFLTLIILLSSHPA